MRFHSPLECRCSLASWHLRHSDPSARRFLTIVMCMEGPWLIMSRRTGLLDARGRAPVSTGRLSSAYTTVGGPGGPARCAHPCTTRGDVPIEILRGDIWQHGPPGRDT